MANPTMLRRIHWLRIILTAVLVELVLLAIAIPLNLSANGRAILLAIVIPLCAAGAFAVVSGASGGLVARRLQRADAKPV